MELLYGRAGRLTAENGGPRPGQFSEEGGDAVATFTWASIGLGRIVASKTVAPILFVDLVYRYKVDEWSCQATT